MDDSTTSKTLNKSSTEKPGRKMSIGDGLKTTPAPAAPTSQPQAVNMHAVSLTRTCVAVHALL